MFSGYKTLMLDEQTNHMDMPAKEIITEAFQEYDGTLLSISHDRNFIESVATDIWEIYNGRLLTYGGDYAYYMGKRKEMRARFTSATQIASLAAADKTSSSAEPTAHERHLERKAIKKECQRQEKKIDCPPRIDPNKTREWDHDTACLIAA